MITVETPYTIPSTILLQVVDDEVLLFNSATGFFFSLNEIGTVMWEVVNENTTMIDTYRELLEIYDISDEQLQIDLSAFIKALFDNGLLEVK